MNTKFAAIFTLAVGLVAGSLFIAQAQTAEPKVPADPRIDKVIEQNEQILKNQADMMKSLEDLKKGVLQLRVRSS